MSQSPEPPSTSRPVVRECAVGFRVAIAPGGSPADAGDEGPVIEMGAGASVGRRGRWAAVADLRLDNRDDLRLALGADSDAADVDLLLAAYARWGRDVVDRLDGPFAFVVWDGEERAAFAARDPLGRRPLYWARTPSAVILGTSLPGLRLGAPPTVDPEAALDFLRGDVRPLWRTLLRGVARVPAAHALTVRGDDVTGWRYWEAVPRQEPPLEAEREARFQALFDHAVRARLGGGPGAFLSGGLDSSSIVATARHLEPDRPLPTFSIVYRSQREADERRYTESVARHVGVEPVWVDGDRISLLDGLDDDLDAVGEPVFTPNLFMPRTLYAEAAARGLSSVLDGFGGDNVVGHGDRHLTELALGLRWPTLWREASAAARRTRRPRRALADMAAEYVWGPLWDRVRRPPEPISFAHPDLLRGAPVAPQPPRPLSDRAALVQDLGAPTIPRAMEVTYAVARSYGVEPRFPFLDRSLVELSLSLPASERLRDGMTRSILRRSMGDRLPADLQARAGKARLATTFAASLLDRGGETLRRIIEDDAPAVSDLVDVGALRRAFELASNDLAARATLALPIWRAAVLARWAARRLQPPPDTAPPDRLDS